MIDAIARLDDIKASIREYMDECLYRRVMQLTDEDLDYLAAENQISEVEIRGIVLGMI
jgi:hypothetical protein